MDVPEKLDELYAAMLPLVRKNLEDDLRLTPVVFALFPPTSKGWPVQVAGLVYDSQETKRAQYERLCAALAESGALGFVAFNDSWVAIGGDPMIPAGERPDRREAVVATVVGRGGVLKIVTHYYRREGESVVWEESMEGETVEAPLYRAFFRSLQ